MKNALWVKIILIFLCLSLCSCHSSPPQALLTSSFRCEVCWKYGGEEFRASVSADASTESPRGFFMRFTSPEALSGIWIERDTSGSRLYLNGKVIGEPPRNYLIIADSLLSAGSLNYLCSTDIEGIKALCYSSDAFRWYFSSADGRPMRVESSDVTIDILWIEPS